MARVDVRPSEGLARFAGRSVAIAVDGERLRLIEHGVSLRPLRFGERTRLARAIAAAENTPSALAALVLREAAGQAVAGDAALPAAILALHQAGAGSGAPGFAEEVGVLGRWLGWTPADLDAATAVEADALAIAYGRGERWSGPTADKDGWVSFVLEPPAADGPKRSNGLDSLRDELADDLLRRARALPDLDAVAVAGGGGRPHPVTPVGRAAAKGSPAPDPMTAGSDRGGVDTAPGAGFGARPADVDAPGPIDAAPDVESPRAGAPVASRPPAEEVAQGTHPVPHGPPGGPLAARPAGPEPAAPAASGRGGASWVPASPPDEVAGRLEPAALADAYPAIFGAAGGRLPSTPRPPILGPSGSAGAANVFGGPHRAAGSSAPSTGAAGAAGAAGPHVERVAWPAAVRSDGGAERGGDADAVAEALHRAADLRGVAP